MFKRILTTLAALALVASASAISYDLNVEFSGASAPSGTAPWLRATFMDAAGGKVTLTMDSLLQDADEFVASWYFNYVDNANVGGLTFTQIGSSGTFGPVGAFTATSDTDAQFKADGDGYFDIRFDFDTSPPGDRFGGADSITFEISAAWALSAADFNILSAPGGGNGSFHTAAKVQGIGPNAALSGWIGNGGGQVPEAGSTAMMLGIALLAFEGIRRKLRK